MAGEAVGDGVIVDLSMLKSVVRIDPDARIAEVGAGVTRAGLDVLARAAGLWLPVDPSSGAFCTLGGMAATNAAGARSLKHGPMRAWVEALTCIFADGTRALVRRYFGISGAVGTGTTATLAHAAGTAVAGVGPGNATNDVGVQFKVGAQVVPVDTVIYYIRDSATVRNGVSNPALWRIIGAGTPQELIEGIEAFQVLYGQDTDGDRLVNTYVSADAVTNWNNIISVTFSMLIRSVEPNSSEIDARTYTLLPGVTFGPANDRYERTQYTTTVSARAREPQATQLGDSRQRGVHLCLRGEPAGRELAYT